MRRSAWPSSCWTGTRRGCPSTRCLLLELVVETWSALEEQKDTEHHTLDVFLEPWTGLMYMVMHAAYTHWLLGTYVQGRRNPVQVHMIR